MIMIRILVVRILVIRIRINKNKIIKTKQRIKISSLIRIITEYMTKSMHSRSRR